MTARSIQVRGVVQGVGFRPFVFRLAHANSLAGWVLNQENGVAIRLEGAEPAIETFLSGLTAPPPAARITTIDGTLCEPAGLHEFTIRETQSACRRPVTRISPDLPVCDVCLAEMRNPANPRFGYPYINCTNCGPRNTARPIVPAPARVPLAHVAPDHAEPGVMLPYAPPHHPLFDAGAPEVLVVTSANRSSEPLAYRDDDAREQLAGLADALAAWTRTSALMGGIYLRLLVPFSVVSHTACTNPLSVFAPENQPDA